MHDFFYEGKQVFISVHAVKRARQRNIAFPDQVYNALNTGKVTRFGRRGIKFASKSKKGRIICLGEDIGHAIIIKTVERGN